MKCDCKKCTDYNERLEELEAKLARVEGLPNQWRDEAQTAYSIPALWVIQCADELDKALENDDG